MKTWISSCRSKLSERDGVALVIVTVFMVALFGFAALSIDTSNVLVARNQLQEGGDSAALAAVVDWAAGSAVSTVQQTARNFASSNKVATNEVTSVKDGSWVNATRTFIETSLLIPDTVPAVQVTTQRTVPMLFAKVVGFSAMSPSTVSVAIAGRANAAGQVLPWSACQGDPPVTPVKCAQIIVKNGNSCSGPGNFGALNLNPGHDQGDGAKNYNENIVNGYQGLVRVGDYFYPEPGNMVGPTKQGLDERLKGLPDYTCTATSAPPNNKRLAIIPVTGNLGNGKSDPVQITGFWIVSLSDPKAGQVTVTFLEAFSGTEVDPTKPPTVGFLNGTALVK